jgi:hypothetical protein
MYIYMLHFHLCIISCLHLCIIGCICIIGSRDVLVLYTLITMICWICLWMAFFCKNAIHDPLL